MFYLDTPLDLLTIIYLLDLFFNFKLLTLILSPHNFILATTLLELTMAAKTNTGTTISGMLYHVL